MSDLKPFKPVPFELGSCLATQGARDAIGLAECSKLIRRHRANDWGDLDEHDRLLNDSAVLNNDGRVFSCYVVGEHRVYVITEWDRSVSTVLLAEEY